MEGIEGKASLIAVALISDLITPALVAGIVTILVNNRQEKLRARRDFITKAFDPSRDAIKTAVDAAVDYFPLAASARTATMEAQILSAEREVRHSVSALLTMHQNPQPGSYYIAERAFDHFVSELTSGSFQNSAAQADIAQLVKIADAGSNLRAALTRMRLDVLRHDVDADFLSSVTSFIFPGQRT